jgi:chemotaxis protein methyltransferase CheR
VAVPAGDGGMTALPAPSEDTEGMEIEMLLAGIRERYGYDFSHYAQASLKRRLVRAREKAALPHFTALLDRLFHDERSFDEFLRHMSITVTEIFRDPPFYRAVREKVVPILKTFPFVKIWHAGCATGEEVYSMAMLLHEEGFLDRARIYATDFNKHSLDVAEKGVYPFKNMSAYASHYHAAGGKGSFSDHVNTSYDLIKFKDYLKERITFSYHNRVTDGVFGEMNLICCRNVLIYFDRTLQDHALGTFTDSLRHGGFLCLGSKETLNFSAAKPFFMPTDAKQRIYRKSG